MHPSAGADCKTRFLIRITGRDSLPGSARDPCLDSCHYLVCDESSVYGRCQGDQETVGTIWAGKRCGN